MRHPTDQILAMDRASNFVEYHHKTLKVFLAERPNQTASDALVPKQGDQRLESHHQQHPVRRQLQLPDSAQGFEQSSHHVQHLHAHDDQRVQSYLARHSHVDFEAVA